MLNINDEKVIELRKYLVGLMRDSEFMYDGSICEYNIPEILTTMYEYINILVLGESYDYMFHWANKCGAWVETEWFDKVLESKIKEDHNENK